MATGTTRRPLLHVRRPADADSYVRTLLPQMARQASIHKRVHPHGLRHTHAYELTMEGVPMPIIQRQLGHPSLATTDRYLAHIDSPGGNRGHPRP